MHGTDLHSPSHLPFTTSTKYVPSTPTSARSHTPVVASYGTQLPRMFALWSSVYALRTITQSTSPMTYLGLAHFIHSFELAPVHD